MNDLAAALEDIFTVSRGVEEKLKQFRNPSGTARSLAATNWVIDLARSPVKILATMIGTQRLAGVISRPQTAASSPARRIIGQNAKDS